MPVCILTSAFSRAVYRVAEQRFVGDSPLSPEFVYPSEVDLCRIPVHHLLWSINLKPFPSSPDDNLECSLWLVRLVLVLSDPPIRHSSRTMDGSVESNGSVAHAKRLKIVEFESDCDG